MLKRIEHREEAIAGAEETRKYIEEHKKLLGSGSEPR
jgi:hypothetical protein